MAAAAVAVAISVPASRAAGAATLAFPGAVGFGADAVGGASGTVYEVTNLNDSGTGSFRDAVSEPHRIIEFEVPGQQQERDAGRLRAWGRRRCYRLVGAVVADDREHPGDQRRGGLRLRRGQRRGLPGQRRLTRP